MADMDEVVAVARRITERLPEEVLGILTLPPVGDWLFPTEARYYGERADYPIFDMRPVLRSEAKEIARLKGELDAARCDVAWFKHCAATGNSLLRRAEVALLAARGDVPQEHYLDGKLARAINKAVFRAKVHWRQRLAEHIAEIKELE